LICLHTLVIARPTLLLFFPHPAPPDLYPLSLHDALPIWLLRRPRTRTVVPRLLPSQRTGPRSHQTGLPPQQTGLPPKRIPLPPSPARRGPTAGHRLRARTGRRRVASRPPS